VRRTPVYDVHLGRTVQVPRPPRLPTFPTPTSNLIEGTTEPRLEGSSPSGPHLSVSPATTEWFESGNRPPDPTQEPEPVPAAVRGAEGSRRRRQRVVLAGVCALGLTVFALASVRAGRIHAAYSPSFAASTTPAPAAVQPAPSAIAAIHVAQPTASPTAASLVAQPDPQAAAAPPAATTNARKATAPSSKADSRRAGTKRAYSPQSL
jgi:hypothetical protein